MAGQKRNRTEERNIYYNNVTEKYDIKYNYKIYNSAKQKNEYKAKWKYGIASIAEAKVELDILKRGGYKPENESITHMNYGRIGPKYRITAKQLL